MVYLGNNILLVTVCVILPVLAAAAKVKHEKGSEIPTKEGPIPISVLPPSHYATYLPFSISSRSNVTDVVSYKSTDPSAITLQRLLTATDEAFLVYFYDSLDANSYRVSADVEEVAASLKGFITVVAIDIRRAVPTVSAASADGALTGASLQWLLSIWNVQVTPSFKLIPAVRSTLSSSASYKGKSLLGGGKQPIDIPLRGPGGINVDWTVEALRKHILSQSSVLASENIIEYLSQDSQLGALKEVIQGNLPSRGNMKSAKGAFKNLKRTVMGENAIEAKIHDHPYAVVLSFSTKDTASSLLKALALRYNGRAIFISVNANKAPAIANHFGVSTTPAVMVFSAHLRGGGGYEAITPSRQVAEGKGYRYEGEVDILSIMAFLDEAAVGLETASNLHKRLLTETYNAWAKTL